MKHANANTWVVSIKDKKNVWLYMLNGVSAYDSTLSFKFLFFFFCCLPFLCCLECLISSFVRMPVNPPFFLRPPSFSSTKSCSCVTQYFVGIEFLDKISNHIDEFNQHKTSSSGVEQFYGGVCLFLFTVRLLRVFWFHAECSMVRRWVWCSTRWVQGGVLTSLRVRWFMATCCWYFMLWKACKQPS